MIRHGIGLVFWAAIVLGSVARGEDDDAKLDELGQTPRLRARFDGSFDSWGEEALGWEKRNMPRSPKWVPSRNGKAFKLDKELPWLSNLALGAEWTIVTIARGAPAENAILWAAGTARGKGSRALALAGTGKGGVKLVTWWGGETKNTLLAVKDVVHFDKQFHLYAVSYSAETQKIALWIDGKKAGESDQLKDADRISGELRFGAFHFAGGGTGGLAPGEGVEIDDFRVYDVALGESSMLQIASANPPWPEGLPMPKERISAYIDTNAVLRLGFEIPERVTIGEGGDKRLYAKGVLAQCGILGEKRFELMPGGLFALGCEGMIFDSNYALGRTNEIVFAGGAIAAFEPTMIKSAAPIKLTGDIRLVTNKALAFRASLEGAGNIVKSGLSALGLQYPCDKATGTLTVATPSTVVLGPAASWGGTIVLTKGATLRCVSTNQVAHIVAPKGAHVIASNPDKLYGEETFPKPTTAYNLAKMQRERMGRGVYAVRQTADEVMVGWRYKSSDPTNIAFNVYANGKKLNAAPIRDVTYFRTPWTGAKTKYTVTGVLPSGKEGAYPVSSSWTLPANAPVGYFDIELKPPPPTRMPDGALCRHVPVDCSIGDLDGDGEYELVVIWWPGWWPKSDPGGGADNSSWHKTGDTWLEGVKLDGTNHSLWKINLGPNIRSGSHYAPVMVCDMDGDGKAEVVCRTAPGCVDGAGKVQSDSGAYLSAARASFFDWRAHIPGAHILWARNYVTAFDGATGAVIDSVPFHQDILNDTKRRAEAEARAKEGKDKDGMAADERAINREWSSRNPGNQAFRMLGAVAYLDGVHPSAVMCRGYYSRTTLTAYDLVDKKLKERWHFCSDDLRWQGYGSQGFHNLRVGDVDFDGKDEIIYGHMVVDHDGQGLHTTGMGHGDAIHLIQRDPNTRGLQLWTCHESTTPGARFGVTLWDAQTGLRLFHKDGPSDTGSCNAADVDPASPGMELFSGKHCGFYSATTLNALPHYKKEAYYQCQRFGIWWQGDLTRSLYSGGTIINGYSVKGRTLAYSIDLDNDKSPDGLPGCHANHGTKGCPCLAADIFGDWREELLLTRRDNKAIRVFMSNIDTPYRFHTFLEDPVYRISVLTQNNGYNVPTDPGFYFGPELLGHGIWWRGTYLK